MKIAVGKLDNLTLLFTAYCLACSKGGDFHDAAPAADSAALRGVCAPTTFNLNAQRRRMAGGVPARPLVSAGTRARNCSPNHCVQQAAAREEESRVEMDKMRSDLNAAKTETEEQRSNAEDTNRKLEFAQVAAAPSHAEPNQWGRSSPAYTHSKKTPRTAHCAPPTTHSPLSHGSEELPPRCKPIRMGP